MLIKGGKIFDTEQGFVERNLCIVGDKIIEDSYGASVNVDGCFVIPGLTDLHFHGCMGAELSDGDSDGLQLMADYELSRGVTQICPTGMTLAEPQLLKLCRTAAEHKKHAARGAELVGINLEGPFLSHAKKGAQNGAYLHEPDPEFLLKLKAESDGLVKLVSIAPELPGAIDFIRTVKDEVTVSIGHTSCNYEQALEAFDAGAKQVTHLFNAMNPLLHRSPGPIGAAADSDCRVELICDGLHIHPAVIRLVFRLFGKDRVIIISDSLRATGMPDGQYEFGGQDIFVNGMKATLTDGTIAGSVTDLMGGMVQAVRSGVSLSDAVTAAAVNPAKVLGIYDRFGSLDAGKEANIVILNPDLSLRAVVFRGNTVFGNLE